MLIEEALTSNLDLRTWSDLIERRERVYVTDARSMFACNGMRLRHQPIAEWRSKELCYERPAGSQDPM